MTPTEPQGSRYTDLSAKRKLAAKLLQPVKKSGFQNLRTDDIAKYMDLSKATVYKYFNSKDEIIECLVDLYVEFIMEADSEWQTDTDSYVKGFQKAFTQTLLIANYVTEAFHNDLRDVYPDLMDKVRRALHQRNDRLRHFYEQGMEAGVFHKVNATLVISQDELVLRNLVDPMFLMERNLTLRDALFDYYQMKKLQLLTQQVCESCDNAEMNGQLDYLAQKISQSMR
ncbi:MAG: TetR/AcrR family transcriptional regulator [Tumebacillaceae bacterium]